MQDAGSLVMQREIGGVDLRLLQTGSTKEKNSGDVSAESNDTAHCVFGHRHHKRS